MTSFIQRNSKVLVLAMALGSMTLLAGCVADGNGMHAQSMYDGQHYARHHRQNGMMAGSGVGMWFGVGPNRHRCGMRSHYSGMWYGNHRC
jgi:hypothetical protein